jgi:hypothetical protein
MGVIYHQSKFWVMNNDYDEFWNIHLDNLLSEFSFQCIDEYFAMLGPDKLRIANYPHACFMKYGASRRPSRANILRAYLLLKAAYKEQEKREFLETVKQYNKDHGEKS